jgi:hypothetical protein
MHRFLHHRPSPAMIVALLALVFSLGGTSYAAVALQANSVGTTQLQKGAVTTSKIKKGAVTGSRVKSDSLTGANILESTLGKVPAAKSADNASALGGYAASSLARVAFGSSSTSVTAGSTSVTIASVSITAPAAGFVLVNGYVTANGGTGTFYVRVRDDSTSVTSPWFNGVTVAGAYQTGGNETVFPVTAGTRSFSVSADDSSATFTGYGTISAVFIPFGSSGSPTSLSVKSGGPASTTPQAIPGH